MKKLLVILLALAMVFSMSACGKKEVESAEILTEVTDVTVPEFTVKICGAEITNETLKECNLYSAVAKSVNSKGNASENTYVGYRMSDVIDAVQITVTGSTVQIICTDGYESTYEGDLFEEGVLLAITKNGETFKDGPWFAPCTSNVSGDYAQDISEIKVE